jgi:outer membrane protein assembly factor BamD
MPERSRFPVRRPARTIVALAAALLAACGGNPDRDLDPEADAQALYERAGKSLRSGNYPRAIELLESLTGRFPFSDYTRQAQIDLIYLYYKSNEPESAIDAADQFMRENPAHARVDYALYIKGLLHFERHRGPLERMLRVDLARRPSDDLKAALADFAQLVQRFPDSPYAADAEQRMVYLRNRLAEHENYVAEFYLERGAWVAAAQRAKHTLATYEGAPATRKSLQILIQSYRALELDKLADDAERVLEASFSDRRRGLAKFEEAPPPEPVRVGAETP